MTVTIYRVSLAQALTDLGRLDEAAGSYACECGGLTPAADLIDVRDRPDLFKAQFICPACREVLNRQETYEREQAEKATAALEGQVDDETLNWLKAERKWRLTDTDWVEATAARERIGPERTAALEAYRTACHAVIEHYRATAEVVAFPEAPE